MNKEEFNYIVSNVMGMEVLDDDFELFLQMDKIMVDTIKALAVLSAKHNRNLDVIVHTALETTVNIFDEKGLEGFIDGKDKMEG